jgi:hypothetical protein
MGVRIIDDAGTLLETCGRSANGTYGQPCRAPERRRLLEQYDAASEARGSKGRHQCRTAAADYNDIEVRTRWLHAYSAACIASAVKVRLVGSARIALVDAADMTRAARCACIRMKLAQERELRTRRQGLAEKVHEAFAKLSDLATAGKLDAPSDRPVASAAFLVAREQIQSFQHAAARAADDSPQLALLCTGPWPPYSFVSKGVGPGARQAKR